MNDFVALLIAVAAFLLAMMAGQALMNAVHGAVGYSETVVAFGPVLRLLLSLGVAVLAYRKLHRADPACRDASGRFNKA